MQKNRSLLLLLCICLLVVGCTSIGKINALQPEIDDAVPLVYENSPSFIHLPISIKLKDIENKTNNLLIGLIYEDNTIEDDNIEVKIWKLAPIQFENKEGKIKTILPLKAKIRYRIGTKKMGIQIYNTKEFNLNGVVTLVSDIDLVNWKLSTKTQFQTVEWNESPTMSLLGKNIPVTFLINSSLPVFKSRIEKKIDESIAKNLDFKPNVLNTLEKICLPFQISQEYESWLRATPIEIYTTTAKLTNDSIVINMGLKCTIETIVGKKPEPKFNANSIVLKPVIKIPNTVIANIAAVSSYQDASNLISKNFKGQEFSIGKKKIKVLDVQIWSKKGKIIITLEVQGNVNSTIYLTGIPMYDAVSKELFFEQMDYALETKSKLLQTANWLVQGIILKKIEANCRYSIRANLEEAEKNLIGYLNNFSPSQGIKVNGKLKSFQFKKIQLTNQAIIANLSIEGEVNISIDGLK